MTEELRLPSLDIAAQATWLDALFAVQQQQWDALLRWQAMLLGMQQDAFDQWVSHWGGGVPLDA
jgi:hypothetical protein